MFFLFSQSFEKRGVFKELQTFLRHKLVSILQEEWPDLQNPVGGRQKQKDGPNLVVYRLVDDFLRCHNLLYTLSVLASEADVNSQPTRGRDQILSPFTQQFMIQKLIFFLKYGQFCAEN